MVGVVVFLALASAVTWLIYGVYVKRGDNVVIRAIAGWLPAARVGSRTISYAQFLDARDTIRIYFASKAAQQAGLAGPVTPEIEQNAFDRIIREAEDQELAEQRHVSVADEEVRTSFAELAAATSSTVPDVAGYLQDTFHWNEEQFRNKVVRPALLEQRLAETFSSSTADQSGMFEAYLVQRLEKPDVKKYLKF